MKRLVLLLALMPAIVARGAGPPPVAPPPGTGEVFRQLADILDCFQKNHVDQNQTRLRENAPAAFAAFVHALDPDAEYLTPTEVGARLATSDVATNAAFTALSPGLTLCRLPALNWPIVEQLTAELPRVRSLILDLRNNPGGNLDAALRTARLFLPPKSVIVNLEYATPDRRTTILSDAATDKCTAPLVVLVNGGTAGEAEVLAAALQANHRGRLVGSRTAGRGRLVSQFPLPDGAALRLPTARFVPTGQPPFDGRGLTPDVVIEPASGSTDGADPVLRAARQLLAK